MKRNRFNSSPAIAAGIPNSRFEAAESRLKAARSGSSSNNGQSTGLDPMMDRYEDYYRWFIEENVGG